jgi:hypothetical protein
VIVNAVADAAVADSESAAAKVTPRVSVSVVLPFTVAPRTIAFVVAIAAADGCAYRLTVVAVDVTLATTIVEITRAAEADVATTTVAPVVAVT